MKEIFTPEEKDLLNRYFIPLINSFLTEKNMFMVCLFSTFQKYPEAGSEFLNKMINRITEIILIKKPGS